MFKHKMQFWIILSLCQIVNAKTFRNAYLSFEMPETWDCILEHTEWVCRSKNPTNAKEAIIILTAKQVGPTDQLTLYSKHLSTPLSNGVRTGNNLSKIVSPPREARYNDHIWIDALHEASEVTNYFTRYLATTKDQIAVLVTFSAHKSKYANYTSVFDKAIQSLRVMSVPNIAGAVESIRPQEGSLPIPNPGGPEISGEGVLGPSPVIQENALAPRKKILVIGLIALIAAGTLYFLTLNKKK